MLNGKISLTKLCKLCSHHDDALGCVFPNNVRMPGPRLTIHQHKLAPNHLLNTVAGSDRISHIHKGWAFTFRTNEKGDRTIGGLYNSGKILGFPAFFDKNINYKVRAMGEVTLCSIDMDIFTQYVRREDAFFKYFQAVTARVLWRLSRKCYELTHNSAEERLCREFIIISLSLYGDLRPYSVSISVTQEILADLVGTSKVHMNRILRGLQKEGVCQVGRGVMTVLDARKLKQKASLSNGDLAAWNQLLNPAQAPQENTANPQILAN